MEEPDPSLPLSELVHHDELTYPPQGHRYCNVCDKQIAPGVACGGRQVFKGQFVDPLAEAFHEAFKRGSPEFEFTTEMFEALARLPQPPDDDDEYEV